jgi:transposase
MLKLEEYMTILTLWKKGCSKSEISRKLDLDRKTVRKVIKGYEEEGTRSPAIRVQGRVIDPYRDRIIVYLEQNLSSVRIQEKLLEQGISLKYRTLSRYVAGLKHKKNICVRFQTESGEEAQVDFGYVGMQPAEASKKKKAWVFNMRLSYSRLDYYEVVFDQTVKTFIKCHINAFKYFGGAPKTVKIDNLKAAILEAHFYEPLQQDTYRQFGEHYGFDCIPCRVREPQEKGKVESGIKFVKGNFFAGRKFASYQNMEQGLIYWLRVKCNSRVHGTTKRVPIELFAAEEKERLKALPIADFIFPEIVRRQVHKDCHIIVHNSYYSVPHEYVGKEVDVIQDDKLIKIRHENQQITVHAISDIPGTFVTNTSHYPRYKNFSHDSKEYLSLYESKMKSIGTHGGEMFSLILEKEPYRWYQITKGILSLSKQYSDRVVELACQRALAFNITSYRKIKNICESGSYNLPNT